MPSPATATVYPLFQPAGFRPEALYAHGMGVIPHSAARRSRPSRDELHLRSQPLPSRAAWRSRIPDLVIMPAQFSSLDVTRQPRGSPIWWNGKTAVYALDGAVGPIMSPPPYGQSRFRSASRCRTCARQMAESPSPLTIEDAAPDRWTEPGLGANCHPGRRRGTIPDAASSRWRALPAIAMWFDSYLNPGKGNDLSYARVRFPGAQPGRPKRAWRCLSQLKRSEGSVGICG